MGFLGKIGSAIAGNPLPIIGGAIGGITDMLGQSSANHSNKNIAQMNNEFNAAEAQKNRDFQLMMWNKQNEYNSPEAMLKRGLNPYLQGASVASTGASASGAQASASGNPTMQPIRPSSVIQAIAEIGMAQKSVAEGQGAQSLMNAAIGKMQGDTDYRNLAIANSGFYKDKGHVFGNLMLNTERQQLTNMEYQAKLLRAQESYTNLQAEAQEVMNKYVDADNQANLMLKAQNLVNLVGSNALSIQQAKTEIAKQVEIYARAKGQAINNKVAQATAESLIESTIATNKLAKDYSDGERPYTKANSKWRANENEQRSRMSTKANNRFNTDRNWDRINQSIGAVGNAVGNIGSLFKPFPSFGKPNGNNNTFSIPKSQPYWDSSY